MNEVSEAYVLGLLSDLERDVPKALDEIGSAGARASLVDAELTRLLQRQEVAEERGRGATSEIGRITTQIGELNNDLAARHQQIAALKRRISELESEMAREGKGALYRRLRRDRARQANMVEDREGEVLQARAEVERMRGELQQTEQVFEDAQAQVQAVRSELDRIQEQLPQPGLYTRAFELQVARAHCNFFLERDVELWERELRESIQFVVQLHRDFRAGKYRLDKNSHLVGGRATATVEAMYGAVVLGEHDLARELFELATDPGLYFHHIFNVYRVWALGFLLTEQEDELRGLLREHQFAEGIRGGYSQCFIALLTGDSTRMGMGLRDITRYDWEQWQDPHVVRGLGVINMGAVALGKLALDRGISVNIPGNTVPNEIVAGGAGVR